MLTGFILTDTKRLASVLSSTQHTLQNTLLSYADTCASYINWLLIDFSDDIYADTDKNDWHSYASALNDYYYGIGMQGTTNRPLFIIGGNDIVPMPPIENPLEGAGREYLYSDMVYCFETSNNIQLKDLLISTKPRFAVGRLPITKDWNIDVLSDYLTECDYYSKNGIPIRGAAMTTTQSWLRASSEMMRDIPTAPLSSDYVPLNNRMIVSPDLDTEYQDMYDGYIHELKKIDFLVCNLHGSDEYEMPFFIGQSIDKNDHFIYIATHPKMMQETTPLIFNTVACFGARYSDYDLDSSMLLSALYYGTMLYCGACDLAFGGPGREGCSELMMKLYNIYLHKGLPAGMALLKAKQDYYSTCHYDDEDIESLYTILEFNLFGCPILWMQPKLKAEYQPVLLGRHVIEDISRSTYRPKIVKTIDQSVYRADDIHAYLQRLVDNNLSEIRQKVEKEVYQRLGLGAENLQRVMRVSQDSREIGYQFIYNNSQKTSKYQFEMLYLVDTDNYGSIIKIIHTK